MPTGRCLETLPKLWVKSNVQKFPSVFLETRTFLTYILVRQVSPISLTFFSRPSKKSFQQKTEIIFDCILANVADPVVRDLCCSSTHNLVKRALHEITVNSYLTRYLLLKNMEAFLPKRLENYPRFLTNQNFLSALALPHLQLLLH